MAIEAPPKKEKVYYRVANEFEDGDEIWCVDGNANMEKVSALSKQDPLIFKINGQPYILDRGQHLTLSEGEVKFLLGDWDLDDDVLWERNQKTRLGALGFIPKLKIEKLLTPQEKADQDERLQIKSKFERPKPGEVVAKAAPRTPIAEDEPAPVGGFTAAAIEKAEQKKGPGRTRKEA